MDFKTLSLEWIAAETDSKIVEMLGETAAWTHHPGATEIPKHYKKIYPDPHELMALLWAIREEANSGLFDG